MRKVIYDIDLNMQEYDIKACMQNDDINLIINIYENEKLYNLTGAKATLNWSKPDGTPMKNNMDIDKNIISITLNKDYTDIKGKARLDVEITKEGTVSTFPLCLVIVEKVFQSKKVNNKIIEVLETIQMDEYVDTFMDSVKANVKELSSQIDEIASTGTTVEVVQNKVQDMAEKGQIQAYTIGNKTINASEKIADKSITQELISDEVKLGVQIDDENSSDTTTYSSKKIKEELNNKISDLADTIVTYGKNLFNENGIIEGYIKPDGTISDSSGFLYNKTPLAVSEGEKICFGRSKEVNPSEGGSLQATTAIYVTAYDINKNVLVNKGVENVSAYIVPNDVFFITYTLNSTAYNNGYAIQIEKDALTIYEQYKAPKCTYTLSKNVIEYVTKTDFIDEIANIRSSIQLSLFDYLSGKKLGALGDSITVGYSSTTNYHKLICEKYNMIDNNYGIVGTNLSNNDTTYGKGMVNRYVDMDDDIDIIIVFGGTNDFTNNVVLGSLDSTDDTTFCGALNTICDGLRTKYPTSTIIFVTPCHYTNSANTNGDNLLDFVNAELEICANKGFVCYDAYRKSGLNTYISEYRPYVANDMKHLNERGHSILASKLLNILCDNILQF